VRMPTICLTGNGEPVPAPSRPSGIGSTGSEARVAPNKHAPSPPSYGRRSALNEAVAKAGYGIARL
jgi:hypothetical protein